MTSTLHLLRKVEDGVFLYQEHNAWLDSRSPEFVARAACPRVPAEWITVEGVERGATHSDIRIRITVPA